MPPGGTGTGASGATGGSSAGFGTGGTGGTLGGGAPAAGTGTGGGGSGSPAGGAGGRGGTSGAESGGAGPSAGMSSGTGGSAGDGGGALAGMAGMPATVACDASKKPAIGALGLRKVFQSSELATVSFAAQPPDSDDWYLVEQRGRIRVLSGGVLAPTPFYDVTSEIALDPSYDERGLHSIAFAPDYATSGLFYIVLTPTEGERKDRDLLLEHQRSAADPYVADMTPKRTIMSTM